MKKVAKVFFIIAIGCLLITGICFIIAKVNEPKADKAYKEYRSVKYDDRNYRQLEWTYWQYSKKVDGAYTGAIIAGLSAGLCVILGVSLKVLNKIKEKKGRDFFYKVILGIGIFIVAVGIIGSTIWVIAKPYYDEEAMILSFVCGAIGGTFIWGYITYRLMKGKEYSFLLGFLLGIIGVIIAIVKRMDEHKETNNINSSNKYEDLERLQKLKENGVITEAEFEIEKTKLLK